MNRDDVIRWAREAGFEKIISIDENTGIRTVQVYAPDSLERFAAIVAAAAIHNDLLWQAETETAVLGEREACAKVCEDGVETSDEWEHSYWDQACENRAAAIRARKENT